MPLDTETRQLIDELVHRNQVVLFMKGTPQQPQCGFSAKSIAALNMLIPDYATVDVLEHPAIREGIKEYGNWPTIPQLYVGGELIGGNDIIEDMMANGELAETLGIEKPDVTEPSIEISSEGIEVMKRALESQPGGALHLSIGAAWTHQISLDPNRTGAVQVDVGGIVIHMDPWSAARADGLRMVLEEDLTGTRFVFDNPNAPPPVEQISVHDLKKKMDDGDHFVLIDVRGDDEREIAAIKPSRQWNEETRGYVESLPKDAELVLYCQMGGRSQALAEALRQRGFTKLRNVKGGIRAWSEEIDASVPTY